MLRGEEPVIWTKTWVDLKYSLVKMLLKVNYVEKYQRTQKVEHGIQ